MLSLTSCISVWFLKSSRRILWSGRTPCQTYLVSRPIFLLTLKATHSAGERRSDLLLCTRPCLHSDARAQSLTRKVSPFNYFHVPSLVSTMSLDRSQVCSWSVNVVHLQHRQLWESFRPLIYQSRLCNIHSDYSPCLSVGTFLPRTS